VCQTANRKFTKCFTRSKGKYTPANDEPQVLKQMHLDLTMYLQFCGSFKSKKLDLKIANPHITKRWVQKMFANLQIATFADGLLFFQIL
jgi:hypothetical protein